MRLTIIRPDNIVAIDGMAMRIDLSTLPSNLRVVQWDNDRGMIEWTDKPNSEILSISEYQQYIDTWTAQKKESDDRLSDPYYGMSATAKAAAIKKKDEDTIRNEGSVKLLALGAPYSAEERETWTTQEKEARAWALDHMSPTPMISNMAFSRGIPLEIMAQKIIENADLFKVMAGKILGEQQKSLDALGA